MLPAPARPEVRARSRLARLDTLAPGHPGWLTDTGPAAAPTAGYWPEYTIGGYGLHGQRAACPVVLSEVICRWRNP
jgi:hypothetical protein